MITANRSLERTEVTRGEKIRVLIYRLFAFDDTHTYLLENKELKARNIIQGDLEAYLYNDDYDFFVI